MDTCTIIDSVFTNLPEGILVVVSLTRFFTSSREPLLLWQNESPNKYNPLEDVSEEKIHPDEVVLQKKDKEWMTLTPIRDFNKVTQYLYSQDAHMYVPVRVCQALTISDLRKQKPNSLYNMDILLSYMTGDLVNIITSYLITHRIPFENVVLSCESAPGTNEAFILSEDTKLAIGGFEDGDEQGKWAMVSYSQRTFFVTVQMGATFHRHVSSPHSQNALRCLLNFV